jgi:hypothetical protein
VKKFVFCSAAFIGVAFSSAAIAQNNPFVPPQPSMSRAQIEQIVRQEVAKQQPAGNPGAKPGAPGAPANAQAGNGAANNPAAPQKPEAPAIDPVAELLKDGGIFVGCVSGTPVFKDKAGRRAYFTTKELRESNEARRFARCG